MRKFRPGDLVVATEHSTLWASDDVYVDDCLDDADPCDVCMFVCRSQNSKDLSLVIARGYVAFITTSRLNLA